jgi:WD40 repeat protein
MPDAELTALINTLPAAQRPVVLAYLNADWQTYERLDPNRVILRAAYELAPRELRRALGSVGRTGGRTEIVEILATSQTAPPTPHIPTTPTEADILFETLTAQRRYADLWKLAQTAAPLLSARILVWLDKEGWQPDTTEDRAVFPHLVKLAVPCTDLSPQYGLMYKKRRISFARTFRYDQSTIITPDGQLLLRHRDNKLEIYTIPEKSFQGEIEADLINETTSSVAWIHTTDDPRIVHLHPRWGYSYVANLSEKKILKTLNKKGLSLPNNKEIRYIPTGKMHGDPSFIILYDTVTNEKILTFEGVTPHAVVKSVVSPNNKVLAVSSYWNIWFWDIGTGQKLLEVASTICLSHLGTFTFSPDSRQVLISGYEGRVHILDLASGKLIEEINTPNVGTRSLTFSPDGKILAVGSGAQNISLYNFETRELIQNMLGLGNEVTQVVFRDDGTIVSSSRYGFICVWASRLMELCNRPLEQNEMRILRWMSKQLNRSDLTAAERGWLEFTQAMLHLRWRYAVEIETDAAYKVRAAPADIEL